MPQMNNHPQLRNDYRTQFMPMRRRIYDEVATMRTAAMGALERAEGRQGVAHAVDILWTRDLLERARSGQAIMAGLNEDELAAHLAHLEAGASEEVRRSVGLMRAALDEMGQALVERGKLSELREQYAPHHVVDYVPAFMLSKGDTSAAIQKKFGEPYRSYTRKAVGSQRVIETSEDTIWSHVAKVLLDNRMEDWMLAQAEKYDARSAWQEQNKGQRLKAGMVVDVDGAKHVAIRWRRNNFTATALDEDMLAIALRDELRVEEWLKMRGPRGGRPISEIRAIGADTLYLVPEDVAGTLQNLMEYSDPMWDILYSINTATRHWKAITLATAGLPYQLGNIIGDTINMVLFDPVAMKYMGASVRVATTMFFPERAAKNGIELTSFERELMRVAQEQDVAYSSFMTEVRYYGAKQKGLQLYQNLSDWREALNRMAILAHQLDRVRHGRPVQRVAAIDIEGLDPESQAGKVSRESLVDYGSTPRLYKRLLSNLLAPFIRFHEQNFRNHFRTAIKQPQKYWWKVLVPYLAAWWWNNGDDDRQKKELLLPDYIRNRMHVLLWEAEDPGMQWVWAPQQPVDMAAAWLGMDTIGRISSDLHAGKITAKEAAGEFANEVMQAPGESLAAVAGPLVQWAIGLKTNRDPFTKGRIMPDWIFREQENGWRSKAAPYLVQYTMEKMLTPIAQYTRRNRSQEPAGNAMWDAIKNGPWALRRALGFYPVDLTTSIVTEAYDEASEQKATYAWHKDRIYKMYEKKGLAAEEEVQQYLSELRLDQEIDLRDNLKRWKQTPSLTIVIARAELQRAKDPETRRKLRTVMAVQRFKQAERPRKSVPKPVR
jgi:hypothetical protein